MKAGIEWIIILLIFIIPFILGIALIISIIRYIWKKGSK